MVDEQFRIVREEFTMGKKSFIEIRIQSKHNRMLKDSGVLEKCEEDQLSNLVATLKDNIKLQQRRLSLRKR